MAISWTKQKVFDSRLWFDILKQYHQVSTVILVTIKRKPTGTLKSQRLKLYSNCRFVYSSFLDLLQDDAVLHSTSGQHRVLHYEDQLQHGHCLHGERLRPHEARTGVSQQV